MDSGVWMDSWFRDHPSFLEGFYTLFVLCMKLVSTAYSRTWYVSKREYQINSHLINPLNSCNLKPLSPVPIADDSPR